MAWVVVAVSTIALGTIHQNMEARKAQKQARKDQLEDQRRARKAEVFSQTEGEGLGQLGSVSLEVDDELDENKAVSSNLKV